MQHRGSALYCLKNRFLIRLTGLSFVLLLLFNLSVSSVYGRAKVSTSEKPENVIIVEDYKWGQSTTGTVAIIREVTLRNKGKSTYKNIEIEVDLYTLNDIPLGSLRATIKDELPAGSEKVFHNISLGLMHSELQQSVFRVVGAELVEPEGVPPSSPKDVITVKNWQWTGGQYATEGIFKEITLENKSKTYYRDINLRLDYLSGNGTLLSTTRAVIYDILPAETEKVFYNVNAGFRDPNASKILISVLDASRIPDKLATNRVRKPKRLTSEEIEKIGVKVSKKQVKADSPDTPDTDGGKEVKEGVFSLGTSKKGRSKKKDVADASADNEELYVYEYMEDEEPVPYADIIVRDYKLGTGITGTIGTLEELTLENISSITYRNIELTLDFYARSDERPIGSNTITINDTLPPYTEKVFQDVKIGFLNSIPEDIKVRVVNARVVR
ncbi:MAG TPA: hypothetical protein VLB01_06695 [Thermodesulfobacteriota bacterium]|nr:hypothetical protein [Thermodesulfobacteriota bacterium]